MIVIPPYLFALNLIAARNGAAAVMRIVAGATVLMPPPDGGRKPARAIISLTFFNAGGVKTNLPVAFLPP
jgi:hypothetical protein